VLVQSADSAWRHPSGGPVEPVHDIGRAGAPNIDLLAPDIHGISFPETAALTPV